MLEELKREMDAKITALYNRKIISSEYYYRVKALVNHPELLKNLELDTLIDLFNELRINNSCKIISSIKGISILEVNKRIEERIGFNNYKTSNIHHNL